MQTRITVGLAQIDTRLGALERNLETHLRWIDQARDRGVELLLFPELSLTGYRLLHLTSHMALRPERSQAVKALLRAIGEMAVIVGVVEKDERGVLYNSALLLHRGEIAHVHRKLYLPTYGIFQEGRFFGRGNRLDLATIDGHRLGVLICEDLWHPHLARRLAAAGGKILAVTSAGPGRIGGGEVPESHDVWESLTRSTALVNTSWLLYCNRVGWEEGSFYTGGSHIVRPGGKVLCRAAFMEEELLVATLDLREVDRLRWRLPLLREERTDIQGPGG
jgi:N-carbamoylputrescine amidase